MVHKKKKWLLIIAAVFLALLASGCGASEPSGTQLFQQDGTDFPAKPVRIIVCRAAGGSTDVVARTFQPYLQKHLGANVIVENIEGAGGKIGLTEAYQAAADGYTLVFGVFPSMVLMQHIEGELEFSMADFVPVYNVNGGESNAVVVAGDSPFKTLEDLVWYGTENPGRINVALTSGITNSSLGYGIMVGATGMDVQRIPYESGSLALQATMGGHVDFTIANSINVYQPAAEGAVRVLAVFNHQRDLNLPEVPTFAELYGEQYAYEAQMGILAPPQTPMEIISILEEASAQAVTDPAFLETAEKIFQVLPLNGRKLEESIRSSYEMSDEFREILETLIEG